MPDKTRTSSRKAEGCTPRKGRITVTASQLHLAREQFAGLRAFQELITALVGEKIKMST